MLDRKIAILVKDTQDLDYYKRIYDHFQYNL